MNIFFFEKPRNDSQSCAYKLCIGVVRTDAPLERVRTIMADLIEAQGITTSEHKNNGTMNLSIFSLPAGTGRHTLARIEKILATPEKK